MSVEIKAWKCNKCGKAYLNAQIVSIKRDMRKPRRLNIANIK